MELYFNVINLNGILNIHCKIEESPVCGEGVNIMIMQCK